LRFELDAPLTGAADATPRASLQWRERVLWFVATLAFAATSAILYWTGGATFDAPRVVFSVDPPDEMTLAAAHLAATYPTISPDGRHLVFVVRGTSDVPQLAVTRRLDSIHL